MNNRQETHNLIPQTVWQNWSGYLDKKSIVCSGLPNLTAQTFVLHELIQGPLQDQSAVLWLVQNTLIKQKIQLLLAYWQQQTKSAHHIADYAENTWLVSVCNNQPVVIVAAYDDLETPIRYSADLGEHFTLEVGATISLYSIRRACIDMNYFENTAANQVGTFAVRGEVMDIWPHGFDQPLRLVFDDKTISKLRWLANDHLPASDCKYFVMPHSDDEHSSSWHEYFPAVVTHVEDNILSKAQTKKLSTHIQLSLLSQPHTIDIAGQVFATTVSDTTFKHRFEKISPKHTLITDNITLAQPHHTIEPFVYLESWYSPVLSLALLAKKPATKPRQASNKQRAFAQSLTQGDFVVHQDHGIGRFSGMISQTIDDIESEYLLVTYADGDKLYVPPYQISKLSKYIGEPKPKLNKLSGTTWLATVKKIREETIHLAHDIIHLSARRQLIKVAQHKTFLEEKKLAQDFPYTLTQDQKQAWEEIMQDLQQGTPMDRLLCGDVGFGKTELALRAAYNTVLNDGQVAILAPTTILVQQHFDIFSKRLQKYNVKVCLLSRWQTKAQQEETLTALREKNCDVVIGTHRLLSRDVTIPNLKLLIIDEEQKFGVKHKDKLKQQRTKLHTLMLSATPIPRTLNYSLSGLRDISVIQTPPPGRLPITTRIIPHEKTDIKTAIESELGRGGQVYYLVRKVQEIPGIAAGLKKLVPDARIEHAHGQLPPKELASIMTTFDHGEIDVLVCSTIIENGLDVPNANTLIVDNAAHFGLSQLYQLRGRIGRSSIQGFAYLFFQRQKLTGIAAKRLQALQGAYELGSGFDIAMRDLEIRGAGNLLGKEQHGQIAAVGLMLYNQLLEETIEHLTHEGHEHTRLDVTIDLPIEATLSTKIVAEEQERLSIYHELGRARTDDELQELAAKVLPHDHDTRMQNMLLLLRLRLLCERVGIYSIDSRILTHDPFDAKLYAQFTPESSKQHIPKLIDHNDEWIFDGTQLTIKISQLSTDNWLKDLYTDLLLLCK